MAKIKVRPLDDRVVIRPAASEEVNSWRNCASPILLKKNLNAVSVVAVGSGRLLESGDRASLSIEVGDIVIYGKFGGMDMEVNGEDVKILRESENSCKGSITNKLFS